MASNEQANLIRYQVLAANRRHFSTLFFAVVAFSWSFGLSVCIAISLVYRGDPGVAFVAAGSVMIAGAFVAQRLFRRERSAFEAMRASWGLVSGEDPTPSSKPSRAGAMAVVIAGQIIVGLVAMALGVALSSFR